MRKPFSEMSDEELDIFIWNGLGKQSGRLQRADAYYELMRRIDENDRRRNTHCKVRSSEN